MVEELLKLKDMLDNGIITKEEFAAAKEELAAKNRIVPLQRKPVSKSGFAPNSRPMHAPPKSPPKVQCSKCGAIYNNNTTYCVVCGSSLSSTKSIKKFEGEKNNPKGATGIALLVLTMLFLLFFVRPIANSISDTRIDKKRISQLCDNYGLDVINIFYEIDLHDKEAKIVSTNFDSLAYEKMFSLQRELPSSFSYTYVQNEENYVVDVKNNTIEKNGHIVYKEKKSSYTTQVENKPASTPEKNVSSSSPSYSTYYVPSPTATKYLGSQGNPPKRVLESIGNTIQNSMKDQDLTFWTSDSGVYITIGMPVKKSDFKLWAASSGRDQFDNFCTTLDELNISAWNVIVHQGYEDSAVVVIEVVDTPNGNLILSYLNGKQSYNFLED